MKTATPQQRKLLFNMVNLAEEENRLAVRVNAVYNSIKNGGFFDGLAITPCEDEDDARVISMKPRSELAAVRKQLKGVMLDAVKLGMGNLGIIQRNYESYVGKPMEQ